MLSLLNTLDRRIVYLMLVVSVGLALIFQRNLPAIPSNQTKDAFATVEAVPTDKIALIGAEWASSTRAENEPQTRAVLHHLMRRHVRIAIIGFDPQGPKNVAAIVEELAKEYGYVYGKDWVNFGFRPADAINTVLKAMVRDMESGVDHDTNNTMLKDHEKLPIMNDLKNIDQVGLIVEVTASSTYERWVAFVQGVKNTPMVFLPTSVMAPEAYQYLDSGQMRGMLTGLKGALEYEAMVGKLGKATSQALALSVAHILIIFLIVIGNVGYIAERRRQKAEQGA